mgnify:CR=1 FL=1
MINLKIDPEFQNQIPPLTDDEYKQLEENILKEGKLLSPLIIWNNILVDGHNRYEIVQEHPEISFSTMPLPFESREEVLAWICKNQLGRRNLTPEQKKYLIGKQYEAEKMKLGGDHGNSRSSNGTFSPNSQNGDLGNSRTTCKKIAAENGISKNTVLRAEQFSKGVDAAEEAVPGTRKKVLSGEVKPTASEIASVARAPPEDRAALVAAICKAKEPLSQKQKSPPATTTPLSDAGTSDEDATSAPTPSEPTFPPKAGESLKADRQQILEIANGRYHAKQLADGAAMLCEVSGAVNSMIRRWESVFRDYPDLLTDAGNRAVVKRTIQKVKDYLQRLEDTI